MKIRLAVVPALAAAAMALGACGSGDSADGEPGQNPFAAQSNSDGPTSAPPPSGSPAPTTTASPEVPSDTTSPSAGGQTQPPTGKSVMIGDWEVQVTEINKSADQAIAEANQFNDTPEHRYLLVTYAATYRGTDPDADLDWALRWTYTSKNQRSYEDTFAMLPGREWPTEAAPGETVKAQVLFDVPPEEMSGGTLTASDFLEEGTFPVP